jgi:prophage regulatory protein
MTQLEPLVVDAKGAAQLLSSGLRTVRSWDAAGKLPAPIRIGGRVVWLVEDIRAWLKAGAPDRETWEAMTVARK